MRYLLFILYTFLSLSSFAQQSTPNFVSLEKVEIRSIVDKLNVVLKDSLIRGSSYGKSFGMLYDDKSDTGDTNVVDSTIREVLKEHNVIKGGYNVHVYWDHYSDQVYSSIAKSAELEIGTFPNYDNYEASPYGGYRKFKDSLRVDLLELLKDEDWYAEHALSSSLNVMIDKIGHVQYILNNHPQNLSRTHKLKWAPALYFGQPRNQFLRVPLLKKYQNGKISDILIDENLSVGITYLDRLYKGKVVQLEPITWSTQILRGNMVVSFVYNAASKSFENPKIHQGDINEAKGFIRWLETYSFSDHVFHWEHWPKSNRYYFSTD